MTIIYDTICMSGGGVNGFSFISALDILIKYEYINLNKITKYVGTSCGSLICFLLNIDYTPNEIITYFKNFNFDYVDLNIDLNLFLSEFGFDNGNKFIELISILFERKYKLSNINFLDLYILTKKKLYIIGTNFTKGCEETFSYESTPKMLILDALRISISVPLVFTPIKYNDCYYIDGSITNHIAYELCNHLTTLCIYLSDIKCFKLENCFDLMYGVISLLIRKKNKELNVFKSLLVKQNECLGNFLLCNTDTLNKLLDIGYKSGLLFLKKEYKLEIKNTKLKIEKSIRTCVENVLDNIILKIK